MRCKWGVSLAVCLAWAAGAPARADDQADMRKLLAKALKAHGGEKKLARYKAVSWQFKGKLYALGGTTDYTADWLIRPPGQTKAAVNVEINGQTVAVVRVLNKDKGWLKVNERTVAMSKDQLAEVKDQNYNFWVATLVPLRDKAFKLSPVGEVKIGKRDAVGMKVTRKGYRDINLYFDKKTGMLLKTETFIKDPDAGKEVSEHWFFQEYKKVEGIQLPAKVKIERDGKKYVDVEETTEIKPEEKVQDSEFDKP
jgi:hypothetical protein